MACVNPDGTLSESARALLARAAAPQTPEELASGLGQPLFKVRSSLRELAGAGLLAEADGAYILTEEGRARL